MGRRVLVVDDEPGIRLGLAEVLGRAGHQVEVAADGQAALERAAGGGFDLVITDLKLPGIDGLALLRELGRRAPRTPVVLITAYGTVEQAVAAMKLGAFDFLCKPFSPHDLLHLVARATDRAPSDTFASARQPRRAGGDRTIVTRDPVLLGVLEVATSVASSRAPVLIQGESGTGKELLARHIHDSGCRRGRPFVAVNCAALPRELLESELFGHERGAFTGAVARKPGKFELADGGTLLLDEVSELEPGLQAKLLRVLQEYEVDRVGGVAPIPVDVRVVATTNRRLRDLVEQGRFRADLYYRLAVIPLTVPPLRERTGDIDPLIDYFLGRFAPPGTVLEPAARAALRARRWPGNVRELEHTVERAVLLARGGPITAELVAEPEPPPVADSVGSLAGLTVREVERRLILETLRRANNNRTRAARLLGISIRTLRNKLAEYRARGEMVAAP